MQKIVKMAAHAARAVKRAMSASVRECEQEGFMDVAFTIALNVANVALNVA
jgi:hypothetical protein